MTNVRKKMLNYFLFFSISFVKKDNPENSYAL